ncbi:MAG TPA: pitrilysin family protein [Steroidobacteraceae bacterium]|jgi:predicted Zn-dependent peptidase|nr:pitrilysin family protein [Steroidobacteraceae bacterium]
MNRAVRVGLCACLAAALAAGAAETQPPPKPAAASVRVEFTDTTLKNGLRVQLVQDHGAPVIALNIAYDVGSRNEPPGRTGFAHLFEHMMFKGSANVGNGEHFYQVFSNGGSMNGTTSNDLTLYFETLPANQLELALFLEADRMRSLAITQDNLDNQRQAVQEERRLRVDNQPYGLADEHFDELFYSNFAYQHSTIGSMDDLNAASVGDVAQFFKTYYAPNNAVLSLVGDFKPDEAMALIHRYFDDIPRQGEPPAVDLSEPEQKAERRETMTDALARATQVQIAYKTPVGNAPDLYALRVLSSVLQQGDSSRLYQTLNKEKELVVNLGGFVDERIGPGGLYIGATVRPGKKAADVEAAIYAEIERLQQQPIAEWELEKAKNSTRFGYLQSIRGAQARATMLGTYTVKFNDPGLINTRVAGFDAVTRADVRRVAKQYLQAKNRTVIVTNPAPAAAATPGA